MRKGACGHDAKATRIACFPPTVLAKRNKLKQGRTMLRCRRMDPAIRTLSDTGWSAI
jgi:hypothetical protein